MTTAIDWDAALPACLDDLGGVFDDPLELIAFAQLPENDSQDWLRLRRLVALGQKVHANGYALPEASFVEALEVTLPATLAWLQASGVSSRRFLVEPLRFCH